MNGEVWRQIITPEHIINLHREGIDRFGGLHSPPKEGCIDQSTGNAYSAGLYTAKHDPPEPVDIGLVFAGYLLFYLAKNHCFVDGNKRIAWMACVRALAYYGLTIGATQEEAEQFVDAVINDRIDSGAGVVDWLAERLEAIH
jgi:death on curing protein